MENIEVKKNVWQKLGEVQSLLKVPKAQQNSFGNYKYRNCEDILEMVKPLLARVGAIIVLNDKLELIGERYYIHAIAKFIDVDTGNIIENGAYAREEESKKGMDSSQLTGSTSSYARKYALNGLLDIDDTKDADTLNVGKNSCTDKQVARMRELQVNEMNVFKRFKVDRLEDLSYEEAEKIISSKEKSLESEGR